MLRSRWSALRTTQVTPQASSRHVCMSRAAGISAPKSQSLWWRTSVGNTPLDIYNLFHYYRLYITHECLWTMRRWETNRGASNTHSLLLWPHIITAASAPRASVLPFLLLPPTQVGGEPAVYLSDLCAQHGTYLVHVKLLRMGWKKKQMKKENVRNKQGLKLDESFHFTKGIATKKWVIIFFFLEHFVLGYSQLIMLWQFQVMCEETQPYIYMYLFSPKPHPQSRLPHNIEQSSMCYPIGSCWLKKGYF